jgi:hypothetical protein
MTLRARVKELVTHLVATTDLNVLTVNLVRRAVRETLGATADKPKLVRAVVREVLEESSTDNDGSECQRDVVREVPTSLSKPVDFRAAATRRDKRKTRDVKKESAHIEAAEIIDACDDHDFAEPNAVVRASPPRRERPMTQKRKAKVIICSDDDDDDDDDDDKKEDSNKTATTSPKRVKTRNAVLMSKRTPHRTPSKEQPRSIAQKPLPTSLKPAPPVQPQQKLEIQKHSFQPDEDKTPVESGETSKKRAKKVTAEPRVKTEVRLQKMLRVARDLGCPVPPSRLRCEVADKIPACIAYLNFKGIKNAAGILSLTRKEISTMRARLDGDKELAALDASNIMDDETAKSGRRARRAAAPRASLAEVDMICGALSSDSDGRASQGSKGGSDRDNGSGCDGSLFDAGSDDDKDD